MTSAAATLRLARTGDAAALSAMTRSLIEDGLTPRYNPLRLARLIRASDNTVVVADDGRGIQGFAVMQFGDERAHLILLAVQPVQRRSGLGRRLVEWLVESAQVAGIASIHLELRADNPGALAFYQSLGFSPSLLVPGYYDGVVAAQRMLKILRPASPD